jgi:hypothetical protein
VPDAHGHPIARRRELATTIADVSITKRDPMRWAARLDVFAAFETRYAGVDAAGGCPGVRIGTLCRRDDGARYCSPWMIRCELVPVGATLLEQTRIAIKLLEESRVACPAHPYSRFVGVRCGRSAIEDFRIAAIEQELRQ